MARQQVEVGGAGGRTVPADALPARHLRRKESRQDGIRRQRGQDRLGDKGQTQEPADQSADGQTILGSPRLRVDPGQKELRRQVRGTTLLHPRIHAAREPLHHTPPLVAHERELFAAHALDSEAPVELIHGEKRGPDQMEAGALHGPVARHFGQPPERQPPQRLHLPAAVLRHRHAHAEAEVRGILGEDVRNAGLVPADPHVPLEAREPAFARRADRRPTSRQTGAARGRQSPGAHRPAHADAWVG